MWAQLSLEQGDVKRSPLSSPSTSFLQPCRHPLGHPVEGNAIPRPRALQPSPTLARERNGDS